MMHFYEISNGWTGESYVRVYAWAESEEQALNMAKEKLKAAAGKAYDESYYERLNIQHWFSADAAPFCSEVSDEGFEMEDGSE